MRFARFLFVVVVVAGCGGAPAAGPTAAPPEHTAEVAAAAPAHAPVPDWVRELHQACDRRLAELGEEETDAQQTDAVATLAAAAAIAVGSQASASPATQGQSTPELERESPTRRRAERAAADHRRAEREIHDAVDRLDAWLARPRGEEWSDAERAELATLRAEVSARCE